MDIFDNGINMNCHAEINSQTVQEANTMSMAENSMIVIETVFTNWTLTVTFDWFPVI